MACFRIWLAIVMPGKARWPPGISAYCSCMSTVFLSAPRVLVCVELVEAHKTDVVASGGLQFAAESCAGIAAERRVPGVESLDGEQFPGPAQAFNVAEIHDPVPFRLAQGEDLARAARLGRGEYHDVHLDLGSVRRVGDDPGSHLARQAAEDAGISRDRVVAADRLEMRPCHLSKETCPGGGPHCSPATEFEACPFPAHDGLIKSDERFGDAVPRPSRPEQIGFFDEQPAILENTERVRYFVGLTANVAGDPAGRIISLGDGGEH